MACVQKLNGSNYDNCSFKVKLLLVKEGGWTTVEDAKPEPVTQEWKSKDAQALATIGLLVDDNQLVHIRKAQSAAEAWMNLEKFHVKKTLSNKVSLMKKICRLRLEKHGDMESHIAKLTELVDKLNDLQPNNFLTDQWQVAILLSSLPDEYETLITALETRSEDDLTLEAVKGKLTDEWMKRRSREACDEGAESVLQTNARGSNDKCFFCKKGGHVKADCEKFKLWKAQKIPKKFNPREKANNVVQEETSCANWTFIVSKRSSGGISWIIDSGATCHITNDRSFFEDLDEGVREEIYVANGYKVTSSGKGAGRVNLLDDAGALRSTTMTDVLFVPSMKCNLLSVKKLVKKGFEFRFNSGGAAIIRDGVVVAVADLHKDQFVLRQQMETVCAVSSSKANCVHDWHRRLGHRDFGAIRKLAQLSNDVKIKSCDCDDTCEVCIRGKMQRTSFPKESESRASVPFELVHTDICGPMKTPTQGERRYFLTFIDDCTRYSSVYILRRKSETLEKLQEFVAMLKNQFGVKPRCLRSDRGGEYTGKQFNAYMKKEGIRVQLTAPYSPQQNGVAERRNRYLMEMARCMLIGAGMHNRYWGEAVVTANYLQNRLPSRTLSRTPFEHLFGKKPLLSFIRPFGSDVYCHVPKEIRTKLDEKAIRLKLVGYSEVTKGYRLLDVATGRIIISRDVRFLQAQDQSRKVGETIDDVVPVSVLQSLFPHDMSNLEAGLRNVPEVDDRNGEEGSDEDFFWTDNEDTIVDSEAEQVHLDEADGASEPVEESAAVR